MLSCSRRHTQLGNRAMASRRRKNAGGWEEKLHSVFVETKHGGAELPEQSLNEAVEWVMEGHEQQQQAAPGGEAEAC